MSIVINTYLYTPTEYHKHLARLNLAGGNKRRDWQECAREEIPADESLRASAQRWLANKKILHSSLSTSTDKGWRTLIARCSRCAACSKAWCFRQLPPSICNFLEQVHLPGRIEAEAEWSMGESVAMAKEEGEQNDLSRQRRWKADSAMIVFFPFFHLSLDLLPPEIQLFFPCNDLFASESHLRWSAWTARPSWTTIGHAVLVQLSWLLRVNTNFLPEILRSWFMCFQSISWRKRLSALVRCQPVWSCLLQRAERMWRRLAVIPAPAATTCRLTCPWGKATHQCGSQNLVQFSKGTKILWLAAGGQSILCL